MRFSIRRGRPRAEQKTTDKGTKELQRKRALGVTDEPLDVCLRFGMISKEQHWAAVHLRWLHHIRFGNMKLRAMHYAKDMEEQPAKKSLNPFWNAKKEKEYRHAEQLLSRHGVFSSVMNVVVFQQWPDFISKSCGVGLKDVSVELTSKDHKQQQEFIDGLNLLVQCWHKP